MGVCILAYNDLTPATHDQDHHPCLRAAPHFEARTAGLDALLGVPPGTAARGLAADGTLATRQWSSSCTQYARMRSLLCQCAHGQPAEAFWVRPEASSLPFGELIHFSDCEGSIGPEASARLAAAFAEHRPSILSKAPAICGEDAPRFIEFYETMQALFEHAAHSGAVCFG